MRAVGAAFACIVFCVVGRSSVTDRLGKNSDVDEFDSLATLLLATYPSMLSRTPRANSMMPRYTRQRQFQMQNEMEPEEGWNIDNLGDLMDAADSDDGDTTKGITLEESGAFGTTDFSMTFKSDGKVVSPWHDMPLELEGGLYNMLTEIPKMTLKKMEVDTKAPGNPIKQDEKKGKARLYHGPIFWNYGCLPQTWEDPNVKGDADVNGAFGDDDPVDVVEIGEASLAMGSFTPVKALGVLSMIDDGELDWKVIAIKADDKHAAEINDVDDIEKFYPGTVSGIREWFRWYKTPDDKPVNGFGHGERALGAADAKKVIEETHGFYKKLLSGETDSGKLWVPSP